MIEIPKVIAVTTKLFPASKVGTFHPYWKEAIEYAELTTPVRLSMFLGQIGIECQGFRVFQEGLNYTSASRLIEVWPTRFRLPRAGEDRALKVFKDGMGNATQFLGNPQKLANYVYASRNGNRDEESGDGYRFRGRGPKQVTGASNYVELTRDLGQYLKTDFIKNPDGLLLPRNGIIAAAWFWKENHINQYADQKLTRNVTRIVNGGYLKLAERTQLSQKALQLLAA